MREVIVKLNEALGHLEEAQETLTHTEDSLTDYMAGEAIVRAAMSAREALELLEDVEEKTCEHSDKS